MTTDTLRKKAAKLIETRGWWRGPFNEDGPAGGRVCLWTAMRRVPVRGSNIDLTKQACREMGFRKTGHLLITEVASWNDSPRRTQADVIARLRGTR